MSADSFQGAINAFNEVRLANGETPKVYTANWQGIIDAILDLKKEWGHADSGEYPDGWLIEVDSNGDVVNSGWAYVPDNGNLWYDTRQGRLMVYLDDGYYQANGADLLTVVQNTTPTQAFQGLLWFNPDQDTLYLYDGAAWNVVNSDVVDLNTTSLLLDSTTSTQLQNATFNVITSFSGGTYNQKLLNQWLITSLGELDTAHNSLKTSLYGAVNSSSDYDTLKANLLNALS